MHYQFIMIYTLKHVKSPLQVVSEVNKGVLTGLCIWVNRTVIIAIFLLVVSEPTMHFPLQVMPICAVPSCKSSPNMNHAAFIFCIITTKTKYDIDIDRHREHSTQQTKGIGIDIRQHTQTKITRLEQTNQRNKTQSQNRELK